MTDELTSSRGYANLLGQLKERIRSAQVRAAQAVTAELVTLYWQIGRDILARQTAMGWGAKVIDRLAQDLRRAFPGLKGFSARNLRNMRDLAREFPDEEIWQQLLPKCPWGHLVKILQKLNDPAEREWYLRATIQHGWSRAVLEAQIDTRLIDRQGSAPTNFDRTLPAPQSDLARETLKDPYNFDFLTLADDARERELQRGLLQHLREFLLELGRGFAFVGSDVPLQVSSKEYYLDLLFYHLRLRCYVVVELKTVEFKPEYAGKLNFYLSAVDDLLRHPDDQPSIGILLCRSKDSIEVEYALRKMGQPIGISEYELSAALPDELRDALPTVEDIEAELGEDPE